MELQVITENDYDALYELWIHTPGMGLNDVDDSREGITKYLRRNPNTCFLAKEDGKVVGAILTGHDGRRGYICHTAVLQEYRKRGIGGSLVSKALSALKEEGITKVALVAFKKNKIGNEFWERQGFTEREDLSYRNKALIRMERIDT